MTKTAARSLALVTLLLFPVACTELPPTAPPQVADSPVVIAPSPPPSGVPPAFPAVERPARIYVAESQPTYETHGSPLASRYVLYDDGTFSLQYASANYPFFQYRGTYEVVNGAVTFRWEGWSVAGPWAAEGTLTDQSLTVRYNLIMELSDFESGVYRRVP